MIILKIRNDVIDKKRGQNLRLFEITEDILRFKVEDFSRLEA